MIQKNNNQLVNVKLNETIQLLLEMHVRILEQKVTFSC